MGSFTFRLRLAEIKTKALSKTACVCVRVLYRNVQHGACVVFQLVDLDSCSGVSPVSNTSKDSDCG